jgi:peroxidase
MHAFCVFCAAFLQLRFGFVIFWRKNISSKAAHKMLMKLTTALGSLQTIFLREHNRIARQIQAKFPLWSDEKVFQHARRIVVAEYQNIVFGEMLPLILGHDKIFPARVTASNYNPNVDASIINEFSTAAFRFGHTLLNGKFNRVDPATGTLLDFYLLRFNFNNDTLYKDPERRMTSIIKGLTAQTAQAFDQFMTKEVTQFLFSMQSDNFLFGEDLAARNIQRGRDHSINPWLSYRHWCGFPTPDDWSIRPPDISQEKWNTLRSLYLRVADIDLFTGGLAEFPVPGGTVGVTFACIIREQFQRFVVGDRYFFTHTNNVGTQLNQNQIGSIRNVRMSDIICLTSNIQHIQSWAFLIPSPPNGPNPLVSCSNAFSLNIDAFFCK